MGKRIRPKHEAGASTNYISRNQALKKLQMTLKDFRRICIIKGIYPHEPRHQKKVNKGSTETKTWYYQKDILFLQHEPILNKFREYKIFMRKLNKAVAKKERDAADRIRENKPTYKLDHIVRERYPSFIDAIRDLDDALTLCFLFARLPKSPKVKSEFSQLCRRLSVEFMHYVITSKSLRKVFISIKGIYYQAEIMGQTVTWIVPHERGHKQVTEVDYTIMATFIEFYSTMLGFVNFRLYQSIGLVYPPQLEGFTNSSDPEEMSERLASLGAALQRTFENMVDEVATVDEFMEDEESEAIKQAKMEREEINRLQKLFENSVFFLNREVPRESLAFAIRSCGGQVGWDNSDLPGSHFNEEDEKITHHIVDRPNIDKKKLNRWYIQPQWVYDCINARKRLPMDSYFPGAVLPPHFSPFVDGNPREIVVTDELSEIDQPESLPISTKETALENSPEVAEPKKKKAKLMDKVKPEFKVQPGMVLKTNAQNAINKEAEDKKLQVMMIPKKHKQVYKKMQFGIKRKAKEAKLLDDKRRKIDTQKETS